MVDQLSLMNDQAISLALGFVMLLATAFMTVTELFDRTEGFSRLKKFKKSCSIAIAVFH
jgi:hypothetical protein